MSELTFLQARDESFNGFAAAWNGLTPIAAPNRVFNPEKVSGPSYTRLAFSSDLGGQQRLSTSVDRNHFIRSGTMEVGCYVKIGKDLDLAYTNCEVVMRWFEKPSLSTIMFFDLTPPQDFGEAGGWYQVAVAAQWRYLTDRAA